MAQTATPIDILQQVWGYPNFRPMQEEIIQSVLDGKDTLALLPTGGGKSICFQVPGLCQEGITIVVSPLIALMKDQVAQLRKRGVSAEALYSGIHFRDIDRILDNCVYGNVKFLYISPERLTTDLMRSRLSQMKVNLLAVDEAHCISQWGYDFRPPYLQIAEVRELLPKATPMIALTATATAEVVEDIQEKLAFREKNVFAKSFERKNLSYVVLQEDKKLEKCLEILTNVKGSSIIYVRSRRQTQEIAQYLQRRGIAAAAYHAGYDITQRTKRQEDWITGKMRVMVATNAFGMGIDKADVRTVIHLTIPDSLEAYFQEAGRAGRDGKKSYAILLYEEADGAQLDTQFESAFPPISTIRRVYRALGSYLQLALGGGMGETYDFDLVSFAKNFNFKAIEAYNALRILEQSGWIALSEAIYIPATLKILVDREQLYDYQLRNRNMERILKLLLRTHQGAHQNYVFIKERDLAKGLNIQAGQLRKAFLMLHQEKIIDYRPSKEEPQIIFLQERVRPEDVTIDLKRYHFLKERHAFRIQKCKAYAEKAVCRSQQLLHYFNQPDPPRCGHCDVCLGRTESGITTEEYKRYREKIKLVLHYKALPLEKILESFSTKHQEKVLKTLEYLLDEGVLEKEEERLVWVSK